MTADEAAALVLERTVQLAKVPAPPLDEGDRADLVTAWWRADGLDPGSDAAGNVRARIRSGEAPAVVVAAHLDTVFPRDVDHGARHVDGRLEGPGVGDDTVAVASLSLLDRMLPRDLAHPVWIAATTGEEGLGNLAGARHLVGSPPAELRALIAVEGNYLGRVATVAVGSVRWKVALQGPGGHAWEAAAAPSAVHALARIVAGLEGLLPGALERAPSSVNVGHISGGEAVNARARRAEMTVDFRSADQDVLSDLESSARDVIDRELGRGVQASIEVIGVRPAGSLPDGHPLVRAADDALAAIGRTPQHVAASTDANAAAAVGVPAIAVGITTGSGEHTLREWIDVEPIADGLGALADTIIRYDRERN